MSDTLSTNNGKVIARNLFLNPNLKGAGTYSTVAENLITNPGFVATGSAVEVRRNYLKGSHALSGAMIAAYASTTRTTVTDPAGVHGQVLEVVTTATAGGVTQNVVTGADMGAAEMPAGVGTFTALFRASAGTMMRVGVEEYSPTIASRGSSFSPWVAATGSWQTITMAYTVTAADSRTRIAVQAQTATTFWVAGFSAEVGSTSGGIIIPGFISPDPDMTAAWTGTAYRTPAVLNGIAATGVTIGDSGIVAGIQTTLPDGTKALRVIRKSLTPGSAWVRIPVTFPTATISTAVATRVSYVGTWFATQIQLYDGALNTPNAALTDPDGDNEFRITTPAAGWGTNRNLLIRPGNSLWDEITVKLPGIFSGTYTGKSFSGASSPSVTGLSQSEDFRTRWTGTVNASTSVLEIEDVAGLTLQNVIAGVSTRDGKPAVRLIATNTSSSSGARFTIPVGDARTLGTFIGTVHQDSAITPPLATSSWQSNLLTLNPIQTAPGNINASGTRNMRLTYTNLVSSYGAYMYHGGTQGSGDVWWTDIGLFEGNYAGEWFSGSAKLEHPYYVGWEGVADNSVSFLYKSFSSSPTFWSVDGISLQTHAFNIETWGGDAQSVPGFRGDDLTIPHSPGQQWVDKYPDSRTISFGMWVIGANEDGSLPVGGSSRELFETNWRKLKKLLWTPHRQINLTKRFKDWETGEIIEATAKAQFAGGLAPTMNGTQRAQFVVQLKLVDPFFYSAEKSFEVSPYEEVYSNTAFQPSPVQGVAGPVQSATDGFGYDGTSGTFKAIMAFRNQKPNDGYEGPIWVPGWGWVYPDLPPDIRGDLRTMYDDSAIKLSYTNDQTAKAGGVTYGTNTKTYVSVTPGESRRFSARVLLTNRANKMRAWVEFYNSAGSMVGTRQYGASTSVPKSANPELSDVKPNTWTKLKTADITVPAGAVRAKIGVGLATDGSDWLAYRTNYAPDPSFEASYPWTEVARNKFKNPMFSHAPATVSGLFHYINSFDNPDAFRTSGELELARNYILNPSFEAGFNTWKLTSTAGNVSWVINSTNPSSGTRSALVTSTGTTASGTMVTDTLVTPSGSIGFQVQARGTNATLVVKLEEIENGSVITTSTSATTTLSNATTWTGVSVSILNKKSTTTNRVTLTISSTGGVALSNVGIDSAAFGTASFFYAGTPMSADGMFRYKLDPAKTINTPSLSGVGESIWYIRQLPNYPSSLENGLVVGQASMTEVVPGSNTSFGLFNAGQPDIAAAGIPIVRFSSNDVGQKITVTAYIRIPTGYTSTTDTTLSATNVSRGIFVPGVSSAGRVQAPATPGVHKLRVVVTPTAAGQTVNLGGGGSTNQAVYWGKVTVVVGDYRGDPFSGSSKAPSGTKSIPGGGTVPWDDSDSITYSWVGGSNNGPSVMKAKLPTGVASTSIPIAHRTKRYSYEGSYSLNIIRNGTAVEAAAGVSIGTYPAGYYMVTAQVRIPSDYVATEDVSGATGTSRAVEVIGGVNAKAVQAPSTPGVHQIEGLFKLSATDQIRLSGGGLEGQELQWLAVSVVPVVSNIFARNIIGAPFSGNTMANDFIIRWSGVPGNSESIVSSKVLDAGEDFQDAYATMPAIQSELWASQGYNSARGIHIGSSASTAIMYLNPAWLPTRKGTYTLYAQVRLHSPLSGSEAGTSRRFQLGTIGLQLNSAQIPNTAGVHEVRWTFTLSEDVSRWFEFSFISGHMVGEVFIDAMVITQNTYTGGYFDGNSNGARWISGVNNSRSEILPDVIYANKFAAVTAASPYDFFTGAGLDTTEPEPSIPYTYGWKAAVNGSPSIMFEPMTTPAVLNVPGDYRTNKIRFEVTPSVSSFTIKNSSDDGDIEMTYGWGTEDAPTEIDVEKFSARTGDFKTSAYVETQGSHFWFLLSPGENSILTSGTGTGNLIMYYRPAWL